MTRGVLNATASSPVSTFYDVSFWTSQNRPVHFPYLGYFAESHCNGNTDSYDKTSPENRVANHLKRKVTPRRPKNGDVRTREYLTEREVERLIKGCEGTRRPHRDQTMIL